jgi:hypothetical protein
MVLRRLKVLLNPILKPVLNALFFHAYSPPSCAVRIIPARMGRGERTVRRKARLTQIDTRAAPLNENVLSRKR